MKKPLLVRNLVALVALSLGLSSLAAGMGGCKSSGSSADDGDEADDGGAPSVAASGGDGGGGLADATGGADASNPAGAGAPSDAGSPGQGEAGAPNTNATGALPSTTFLYVRSVTPDIDHLVSLDYSTGNTSVVTDLQGDGSDGWEIWGHAISPDRTRIAIASLYGPTKADNATGLATRRIWTLAADGSDFQRLTPVFENDGAGRKNYSIDLQDPVYTQDGSGIIYDYGTWWYEGTTLTGGTGPWLVSTQGDLPEYLPTGASCTLVVNPSVNPATGDVLMIHDACLSTADAGLYLYPSAGGAAPSKLVNRGYGPGGVDPWLETASWLADGSGFIFVANVEVTRGPDIEITGSILLYDMEQGQASILMSPDAGTDVRNAAIAPNGDGIVYCLAHDDVFNLHAIDYTVDPPVDSPITDDGISCSPVF